MEFGFAVYSDKNVDRDTIAAIYAFERRIEPFLETKDYGASIKTYVIGIICKSPQFDNDRWNGVPKKYSKSKKLLQYQIKLSYAQIENATEKEIQNILAYTLLGSLGIIDELKIKNFDTEKFREDLNLFFEENGIVWDKEPVPATFPPPNSNNNLESQVSYELDGLYEISLMIHGIKNLREEHLAEFFQMIQEANPAYLPEKVGANTPLKTPFSFEGVPKVWAESKNSVENHSVMFESSNCKGYIICNREKLSSINLIVSRELVFKDDGIDKFIDLSKKLFLWINGVYGFSCFVVDYLSNLLVLDFRVCLGGISWLTLFGPPYVDMFGKEVIKTTPCLVEEFAENYCMLLTSEVPMPIKPGLVKKQTKVKKHLGVDAFCGKNPPRTMEALENARGKFRAPDLSSYTI